MRGPGGLPAVSEHARPPAVLGHPRGLAVQSAGAVYVPVPKAMSTTLRAMLMLDETQLINSR